MSKFKTEQYNIENPPSIDDEIEQRLAIERYQTMSGREYSAVNSLKDPQKIMNTATSEIINAAKFNAWFDNYSFKWVPDFCKPLIKGWVYAAWKDSKND